MCYFLWQSGIQVGMCYMEMDVCVCNSGIVNHNGKILFVCSRRGWLQTLRTKLMSSRSQKNFGYFADHSKLIIDQTNGETYHVN